MHTQVRIEHEICHTEYLVVFTHGYPPLKYTRRDNYIFFIVISIAFLNKLGEIVSLMIFTALLYVRLLMHG